MQYQIDIKDEILEAKLGEKITFPTLTAFGK